MVKAANESGGYGMLMGPQASQAEIEEFRDRIEADPRNYIAQPVMTLRTHPTDVTGSFEAAPRRPAALHPLRREECSCCRAA